MICYAGFDPNEDPLAKAKIGRPRRTTHCINGHALTRDNTRQTTIGKWTGLKCLACQRKNAQQRYTEDAALREKMKKAARDRYWRNKTESDTVA